MDPANGEESRDDKNCKIKTQKTKKHSKNITHFNILKINGMKNEK